MQHGCKYATIFSVSIFKIDAMGPTGWPMENQTQSFTVIFKNIHQAKNLFYLYWFSVIQLICTLNFKWFEIVLRFGLTGKWFLRFTKITLNFGLDFVEKKAKIKSKDKCYKRKKQSKHTMPSKKRNPVHSIALCWVDFQSLNSHPNLLFSRKTFQNLVGHASLDTFWVRIDWL